MNPLWKDQRKSNAAGRTRTRRGVAFRVASVLLFLALGFLTMLVLAVPNGQEYVVAKVLIPWMWVALFVLVGVSLMSLIWVRYRIRAIRIWLSGVRGQYLLAQIGAGERASLAALFENHELLPSRDIAVIVTVDHRGFSFWGGSVSEPSGIILWSEVDGVRAVETVRLSTQSAELEISTPRLSSPLSMPLVSLCPLAIVAMRFSKVVKVAEELETVRINTQFGQ